MENIPCDFFSHTVWKLPYKNLEIGENLFFRLFFERFWLMFSVFFVEKKAEEGVNLKFLLCENVCLLLPTFGFVKSNIWFLEKLVVVHRQYFPGDLPPQQTKYQICAHMFCRVEGHNIFSPKTALRVFRWGQTTREWSHRMSRNTYIFFEFNKIEWINTSVWKCYSSKSSWLLLRFSSSFSEMYFIGRKILYALLN